MIMQFAIIVVGLFSIGFGSGYMTRSMVSRRRRRRLPERAFNFAETAKPTATAPRGEA